MNTGPARVLYLNHGAKPGGGEVALWRLLSALDRSRYTPVVVFGEEGPAVEMMRGLGVETRVLPLTGKVREIRKDTLGLGAFLHLGRAAMTAGYAVRVATKGEYKCEVTLDIGPFGQPLKGAATVQVP